MEMNSASSSSSSIRDRIDSWYRSVQYEPWFIKVSTINPKIILTVTVSLILLLIIIIVASAAGPAGDSAESDVRPTPDNGVHYRGHLSTTVTGLQCVNWSQLNRTIHTVTIDRYPDQGIGDHNYCRNPDSSSHIWCYTSVNTNHFDYCNIPVSGKLLNI